MRKSEGRDSRRRMIDIKENNLKLAKVYNNIGCVNFEREEMTSALEAFESAVKLQRSALANEIRDVSVTSTSKPSFLTTACTMCNKGLYIYFRLHIMLRFVVGNVAKPFATLSFRLRGAQIKPIC